MCCLKYVCARVHVYLKRAFKWAVGLLFRLCVQRLKLGQHASVWCCVWVTVRLLQEEKTLNKLAAQKKKIFDAKDEPILSFFKK